MTNLLQETREAIKEAAKHPRDIIFIGSQHSGHRCTWQEFIGLADELYDAGYGGRIVAEDLIIVFSDSSSLVREEYDGSEWWRLVKPFTMPLVSYGIKHLFSDSFMEDTLEGMNATQDEEVTNET
jgi:hypothetical protein